jgi:hypothetical protein
VAITGQEIQTIKELVVTPLSEQIDKQFGQLREELRSTALQHEQRLSQHDEQIADLQGKWAKVLSIGAALAAAFTLAFNLFWGWIKVKLGME